MSRAELARYAGVAPSTISGVVQELVADGFIVGSAGQHGGPPAGLHVRRGRGGPACA